MKFIIGNNEKHETFVINTENIIAIKPNYKNNCNSSIVFTIRGLVEIDRNFESILSELTKGN